MDTLRGQFLLANAGILTPVFRKTVVLVAEHDDEGALGFVVNRPTDVEVDPLEGPLSGLPLLDRRVFSGGPVQPDGVAVLAEYEADRPPDRAIVGSIGLATLDGMETAAIVRAKVIAGYAGWGPGQLEGEIDRDDWLIVPATSEDVFSPRPHDLWSQIVRRKGPSFRLLASMPFDPSAN